MIAFFQKIWAPKKGLLLEVEEGVLAREGTESDRRALAENERTSQEVLYYLALQDPSPKVRKAVAQNKSTPGHANSLLAKDKSDDVRLTLARRLMHVLPELSEDKYSQLYAFTVQALGDLALDEVLKIRRALTATLKDHAHTPPSVALQLAKDLERDVSEPILRFCTALSDEALIDVLASHPAPWAAEAVSRRKRLSAPVSRAVIKTGNRKAGKYLLENEGAEITPDLLEDIVERAREYPEWHRPIAARAELPPLMAQKLAAFANDRVRKILKERSNIDPNLIDDITRITQRRVEYADNAVRQPASDSMGRALAAYKSGELNENMLSDAIAMRDDTFVISALAHLVGTEFDSIKKVLDVRAPKSICSVCWKAGLSMRFAFLLQQSLGNVPPSALLYPRGGKEYPLSREEMEWHLGLIGV